MEYNEILETENVAESLDEEDLIKIGADVVKGFDVDRQSRDKWERNTKQWMKLALQVSDKKTFPWTNASNVKYPLIATAAMQFAARAYPTLVPANGKIVKCRVVGADPTGEKFKRGQRVSKHMSYQVCDEMYEWEEEMDKLLVILPIVGLSFKKTYYDSVKGRNYSCLIHPDNLVVNYWTTCLEEAYRITEIVNLTKREVVERTRSGLFLEVDLGDPVPIARDDETEQQDPGSDTNDEAVPYSFLEQHTYLDLDDDGYSEPYIITVEYTTKKVVRIVPRFKAEGVKVNEHGDVSKIDPLNFYTKFSCIPNPDGSFYDIGFGHLLGPINESVNTLVNQLIDSGTLNNLQSGFIGKGLKLRMADQRFSPGEWKSVNNMADDIKKNIFPLPTKEPSNVLFQLLGMLIQSGKELASVADIFTGKMPGQNTPAYTTQQTVEQGMKLYTAVYKRVYRSLAEEFRKLYNLNSVYLDEEELQGILDEPATLDDYRLPNNDILPAADPSSSSQTEKQQKVQNLFPLMQLGTLDPMALTMEVLEVGEYDNPEKYIRKQPPPPDPKVQAMQMKAQQDQMKAQAELALKEKDMELRQLEAVLKQKEAEMNLKFKEQEAFLDMQFQRLKGMQELQKAEQDHQIQTRRSEEQHQQSLKQKDEQFQQAKKQQPKKEK